MKILIVEDNPVNSQLLEQILQGAGYETVTANSGREALECLPAHTDIQLIVTDIMMPEMDGLQLIEHLRSHFEWKDMPLILLTAHTDRETILKTAKLGCEHYLVKPVKPQELLERVKQVLGKELPLLKEMSQVLAEFGLDKGGYRRVAETFVAQLIAKIVQIEEGVPAESSEDFGKGLREILEGAEILGAERLCRMLKRVNLNSGADLNSQCPGLIKEMKLVLPSLEKNISTLKQQG